MAMDMDILTIITVPGDIHIMVTILIMTTIPTDIMDITDMAEVDTMAAEATVFTAIIIQFLPTRVFSIPDVFLTDQVPQGIAQ